MLIPTPGAVKRPLPKVAFARPRMPNLYQQRLIIVSGKGGVGKSTLAAALALRSASLGQRTLVCELNTKERVSSLLGRPAAGPRISLLEENLWAVDIDSEQALREHALMTLKFESIYNAVFENRLVRYFLRFLPSLQELVTLGKIIFHLREKRPDGSFRFERIVVDGPATGHAISLYRVPEVILQTVPPGPLARETQIMRDLLVDESVTQAVLVSLPEEMPIQETLELHRDLVGQVRMKVAAVVLNGFLPPRFQPADLLALSGVAELAEVARNQLERASQSSLARERLARGTGLPLLEVPRLFHPHFGRAAIEQIAGLLAPLLEAPR